jgi:MFS superfamily sulfate permease-like transporter
MTGGGAKASTAADLVAGISMAGLLLPEAVAYAGIAGLPPQAGVLGLFAGLLVYGWIGRSRFAMVSATSSSAAVLGAATLSLAGPDAALRAALAAALVLATGLAFLAAGAMRLGSICSFISKPVLRGFSFGLALVIIVKQLPHLTGIHSEAGSAPALAWEVLVQLPHWNWHSFALGAASLAALAVLARLPRLPGALLVIALAIGLGQALDLAAHGVAMVGPIDLELSVPSLPVLSQGQWVSIAQLSLALVLLVFAETYGAIRTMALKHGDAVDPDRDLWALGAANLLSGLVHGLPVGAGFSATAANEAAGATSSKSAWIAGLVVLALVALCLPWIALTPAPVLAAVVIHAVSHTLSLSVFRPYFTWRRDRFVVVAAAVAVVALGVLNGLLAGITISLALTLRGLSEPRMTQLGRYGQGHDYLNLAHEGVEPVPGVLILRPEAPLFFANVERMLSEMRKRIADNAPHAFVLSLEETPDLDGTSIEALAAFTAEQGAAGRTTVLARLKDPVLALLHNAMAGQAATRLEGGSVDHAVASLAPGGGAKL